MERKNPFVEGEYYHLYNRGVDKRTVFASAADYKRFLMLLYLANSNEDVRIANVLKSHTYDEVFARERSEPLVSIGAFCLMPNHFHLLISPQVEGGVSRFMLKLQTGYSMYFNTKYERNGSLFQGPFRSIRADDDRYLQYLFAYIHLNPAKLKDRDWKDHLSTHKGLLSYVESYPYSSYGAYLADRHTITDPHAFPTAFSSMESVRAHIIDWMTLPEDTEAK